MPSHSRKKIIDDSKPGTYHCYNRCVRQMFLMEEPKYKERKRWLHDLLVEMASIFSIDICGFALMDNHFHLVVRNRPDVIKKWKDEKVLRRAIRLFPTVFERMGVDSDPTVPLPDWLLEDGEFIAAMRSRLASISWLMKVVQERLATRCNRDDEVTGHFWEGRFHSEPLLTEAAVLACMVYLDLNPIRAGVATKPENARYTSAYYRIRKLQARQRKRDRKRGVEPAADALVPINIRGDFAGDDAVERGLRCSNQGLFDMPLEKYLKIVDWAGRQERKDKRGVIPAGLAPILERLKLDPEKFAECVSEFENPRRAVGDVASLRAEAERTGQKWIRGLRRAAELFGTGE